jgi:hypothetical protein
MAVLSLCNTTCQLDEALAGGFAPVLAPHPLARTRRASLRCTGLSIRLNNALQRLPVTWPADTDGRFRVVFEPFPPRWFMMNLLGGLFVT